MARPIPAVYTNTELDCLADETRAAWALQHPHVYVALTQTWHLDINGWGDVNLVVSFRTQPGPDTIQRVTVALTPKRLAHLQEGTPRTRA